MNNVDHYYCCASCLDCGCECKCHNEEILLEAIKKIQKQSVEFSYKERLHYCDSNKRLQSIADIIKDCLERIK